VAALSILDTAPSAAWVAAGTAARGVRYTYRGAPSICNLVPGQGFASDSLYSPGGRDLAPRVARGLRVHAEAERQIGDSRRLGHLL
jgi:hypothetical protein